MKKLKGIISLFLAVALVAVIVGMCVHNAKKKKSEKTKEHEKELEVDIGVLPDPEDVVVIPDKFVGNFFRIL